jgi:DNA mismatch endonuclease (patch repair protein)
MRKKSKEEIRKNMQAIRSNNTKIEILLGKVLWSKGYRYRKNDRSVFGKPDFTFKKFKVAIFCDSDFWHGRDWTKLNLRLQTNRSYWINKIERNIKRDETVIQHLKSEGWVVLRFWEKDIKKSIEPIVREIEKHLIHK